VHYGLGTPANAQRAVQALLVKDIVDQDKGSSLVTDRFFRLWLAWGVSMVRNSQDRHRFGESGWCGGLGPTIP